MTRLGLDSDYRLPPEEYIHYEGKSFGVTVNDKPQTGRFIFGWEPPQFRRTDLWSETDECVFQATTGFVSRSNIRDYFETETVSHPRRQMAFVFSKVFKHQLAGLDKSIQLSFAQKLIFDFASNSFYSHVFISEIPSLMSLRAICGTFHVYRGLCS